MCNRSVSGEALAVALRTVSKLGNSLAASLARWACPAYFEGRARSELSIFFDWQAWKLWDTAADHRNTGATAATAATATSIVLTWVNHVFSGHACWKWALCRFENIPSNTLCCWPVDHSQVVVGIRVSRVKVACQLVVDLPGMFQMSKDKNESKKWWAFAFERTPASLWPMSRNNGERRI